MSDDWPLKEKREYAWNYFQLHARQRMAAFNFFVVISALLTAGLARSLENDYENPFIGFFLGFGLMAITFLFWKLDRRIGCLIKHAETALKKIERFSIKEENVHDNPLALFSAEESETEKLKKERSCDPRKWHFSYSQCFRYIYIVFAVIGLIGIIIAIFRVIFLFLANMLKILIL